MFYDCRLSSLNFFQIVLFLVDLAIDILKNCSFFMLI